ncbi:hypothetical protein [Vallitalea guaymasensis]|uniref:hypothetical protein n=1 Tax=Vallitalea guaymasensis TaxID=1185412 RepID=UPI00235429FE|nr:hypothetical protein [Vallitalea guaymasensis]
MSKLEINKNKEVINNINYNDQYIFKVTKRQYNKLIINAIVLCIVLALMLIWCFVALIKYPEQNNIYLIIVISFLIIIIMVTLIRSSIKKYSKIYPTVVLKYNKGDINYFDGNQSYRFNVKRINSLTFDKPYYRSNKWLISINISGSLERIKIDILNMNDPEILFRLLTNFNKKLNINKFS